MTQLNGDRPEPQRPILEIDNLALHFDTFEGRAKVLDGVSLSLEAGRHPGRGRRDRLR